MGICLFSSLSFLRLQLLFYRFLFWCVSWFGLHHHVLLFAVGLSVVSRFDSTPVLAPERVEREIREEGKPTPTALPTGRLYTGCTHGGLSSLRGTRIGVFSTRWQGMRLVACG